MGFLQRLQHKFGRYAIRNLMTYIVGAMAAVFVVDFMMPAGMMPMSLVRLLIFDAAAIMQGEVWRVVTFIVIPPGASMIFIVFALYLYWLIGSSLENQWGAFKFNIFYLCGMTGTIIAGMIMGFATNFYLNLSLFLAFAILYPNFEIRLFFLIPVKMKWLAYLNTAFLVYSFVLSSWEGRVVLLVSVLNVILFFGKDFINAIKQKFRKAQWKRSVR